MSSKAGVSPHRMTYQYESYLMHEGKKVYLGLFPTEKLAARARLGAQKAIKAICQ